MNRKILLILSSVAIGLVFLGIFYSDILQAPNQVLFTDWGDGIKNYYSYAWHIRHDSSLVHFEGMNYPYGELHQFTDGQPLLSNSVKILCEWFPAVCDQSIGILHILIFLSFLIAGICLTLILSNSGLPAWVSVLGGVAIAALSPQLFRTSGHLSLSYFCSFPLLWYLLIKGDKRKILRGSIWIFLLNLAVLFIHPYLSLINILFLTLYHFFRIFPAIRVRYQDRLIRVFTQGLLPVMVWKLFLTFFDNHPDRAEDVFYLTGNTATFKSIILPPYGWLNQWLNQFFTIDLPWEGWAYLGIPGVLLLFLLPAYFLYQRVKYKRWWSVEISNVSGWKSMLGAGFILLLFSFGYPYRLGMEFLLDWMPFLKQIRALGRFAWVFYYVFNVFTLLFLWNVLLPKRPAWIWLKKTIMLFVLMLMFIESGFYHQPHSESIKRSANLFDRDQLTEEIPELLPVLDRIGVDSFQAIVPLPYFHIGGAAFSYEAGEIKNMRQALILSYHSGLPLMASAMSRTSETEAKEAILFWTYPWAGKKVWDELPDTSKSFLLLDTGEKMSPSETFWWAMSDSLVHLSGFRINRIEPSRLKQFDRQAWLRWMGMEKIAQGFTQMRKKDSFWFDPAVTDTITLPDEWVKEKARQGTMNSYNTIYEGFEDWFEPGKELSISFWYNHTPRMAHSNTFVVAEIDQEGKEDWTQVSNMRNTNHFAGEWSRMEYRFAVKENTRKVKIFLKSWSRNDEDIFWRDVFLWKAENDLIFENPDGMIFWNNYRIPGNAGSED